METHMHAQCAYWGAESCTSERTQNNREAFICPYWDDVGRSTVTDHQISFAVKYAAKMLRYQDRGMAIKRMDTHALQSGRACALKLAGYNEVHIRKMGRWAPKSNAFLEYIQ